MDQHESRQDADHGRTREEPRGDTQQTPDGRNRHIWGGRSDRLRADGGIHAVMGAKTIPSILWRKSHDSALLLVIWRYVASMTRDQISAGEALWVKTHAPADHRIVLRIDELEWR